MQILDKLETKDKFTLKKRPRRNRLTAPLRDLLTEVRLHPSDLIAPFFVLAGEKRSEKIDSMPGVYRYSVDVLLKKIEEVACAGVKAINLFGYVDSEKKDFKGSEALNPLGVVYTAAKMIKKEFPHVCLMVDIALDPYTTHGHDGLIDEDWIVLNDPTVEVLGKMAVLAAESGVDVVAPSDMMDGRIRYIRRELDEAGFENTAILSYAVKFASAFYGPFRDALGSAPKVGDKKSYQINPANAREAVIECSLDEAEGADMLMVKPALPYLDIIAKFKTETNLPVGAYHVSGEYAMVMAAAERGWVDCERALQESLLSIKRAGADFIFTYVASQPDLLDRII